MIRSISSSEDVDTGLDSSSMVDVSKPNALQCWRCCWSASPVSETSSLPIASPQTMDSST